MNTNYIFIIQICIDEFMIIQFFLKKIIILIKISLLLNSLFWSLKGLNVNI